MLIRAPILTARAVTGKLHFVMAMAQCPALRMQCSAHNVRNATYTRSGQWWVRVAEWLSHSAVVQEVPGSNPGDAESVGQ